ncbi:MAG: phenylphosphate carboxylase subunit gamma [Proteobacteria bacterium]|nr:phenylphosphate carboxylase subunit gamma [Pseudomonadota bacterium]
MMAIWDTYINIDFKDMPEEQERVAIIRDLTPGKYKYRSTFAEVKISKDAAKYPDQLWIRLGRGQLVPTPCSIKIIKFTSVIPKGL